jgi:hypothetical protein
MKRAVMLLAIGIMGAGCVIEAEPTATVRWDFSRTVYDANGSASTLSYACDQAGVDVIDVWIVEPDGTRVSPAGSPFTCRDYRAGVEIADFRRDRYGFEIFAYASHPSGDVLLFDGAASVVLHGGDNAIAVTLLPYQADLDFQARFWRDGAVATACPAGIATLLYTLVDSNNRVVADGAAFCNAPAGIEFRMSSDQGIDLGVYAVRMQGFAAGEIRPSYDSCTVSFDHLANDLVTVDLDYMPTPFVCPEDL